MSSRRPLVGAFALMLASMCWGLGFYAQRVSIEGLSPLVATAGRFVLALPVAVVALAALVRRRVPLPWRAGTVLGALLYVAFAMQTVAMQYTPVARVALLTGLYAVVTPLLQPLFGLGRPTRPQLAAAVLAVVGTALLCGVVVDERALSAPPNIGDLLTVFMAVICAVLVLLVARYAPRANVLALNATQIVVMCAISIVVALLADPAGALGPRLDERAVASLAYLAVFSTAAAFSLQIFGQRHLSPAPAAIVMLLETPIGVVAAVALLGEQMAGLQWLGAVLVLIAVVVAVGGERRGNVAVPP